MQVGLAAHDTNVANAYESVNPLPRYCKQRKACRKLWLAKADSVVACAALPQQGWRKLWF